MTPAEMEKRIVRYGDLQPCKTAFIDAHTPGSDQKENFTIIEVIHVDITIEFSFVIFDIFSSLSLNLWFIVVIVVA